MMHLSIIVSFIFVGFVVAYLLGTYARFALSFLKYFTHYEQD